MPEKVEDRQECYSTLPNPHLMPQAACQLAERRLSHFSLIYK